MWWQRTLLASLGLVTLWSASARAQGQDQNRDLQNQNLQNQDLQLRNISGLDSEEIQKRLTDQLRPYERQLQAVLRTRFPEEKNFVGQLVLLIQEERIPKKLIDSAWLWVRSNRGNSPYPFVYFERVIRLQAARAKIAIPPFDRTIYSERISERNRRNRNRRR